jgi:transposase
MEPLPDLTRLSAAEKDALIEALWARVAALAATVEELKGRLAKNSRNSSKPPSSDGLNKPKPKSLRTRGEKPTGGQKGHTGHTLKRVAQPDRIQTHPPASQCDTCDRPLDTAVVVETRQVFDLPPLRCEVTEHQVLEAQCTCGKVHRGTFPAAVSAPVQYGPHSKAAVVQLSHHHMLPLARTGELMGDLFGLPMSDATVLAIQAEAQVRLAPTVAAMGEALKAAPVAHADETGMRVAGKIHWMHVLVTPLLTWLGAHPKRGKQAFDAFGLLIVFAGTLIHDGWKPYRELACKHGLCNAHHLRELTYVFEQMGQAWAKCLFDLLLAACHEVAAVGAPLPAERIAYYRTAYDQILTTGEAANPRAPPSGKRGRTKQSKALNLIDRLRLYADDVWRFMIDPAVPFTNNLGEQVIRMPKVKQKVSGGFRTAGGLDTFCTIRSYLATMHKQGANLFNALTLTFQGTPPQPRFA